MISRQAVQGTVPGDLPFVNLGCGGRYDPRWINIDFESSRKGITNVDLSSGIPLRDDSAAVVYHSHLLEHFRRDDARRFMRECHRICTPGGLIRVVVPDLESISRLYLEYLESSLEGRQGAAERYDWMMLELFDQTVRERSGGDIGRFIDDHPSLLEFVAERWGRDAARPDSIPAVVRDPGAIFRDRQPAMLIRRILRRARRWLGSALNETDASRALEIGYFRMSGEVHHWMYDRFSLARLLRQSGFDQPRVCDASVSDIPGWSEFSLELEPDDSESKPDSLRLEARKPRM